MLYVINVDPLPKIAFNTSVNTQELLQSLRARSLPRISNQTCQILIILYFQNHKKIMLEVLSFRPLCAIFLSGQNFAVINRPKGLGKYIQILRT